MKEFSYEDIKSATCGFAADRLIGKGSHGWVYRGDLKNLAVAIKKRRHSSKITTADEAAEEAAASKLDNEIEILATLRCPNIVNLVGVAGAGGNNLLVMELMPNGSLHDALHSSSPAAAVSWPRRVAALLQVAMALRYLHGRSPPVVHRDVKSANVLFDARWDARLADFSLAVRIDSAAAAPAGTFGYLDPWYTVPAGLSTKNDVFSFGVLAMEVVSGRRVLDLGFRPASVVDWAAPMIRSGRWMEVCDARAGEPSPELAAAVKGILAVAARCVSPAEERRPAMAEVVGKLQKLLLMKPPAPEVAGGGGGGRFGAWRRWTARKVRSTKAALCRGCRPAGEVGDGGDVFSPGRDGRRRRRCVVAARSCSCSPYWISSCSSIPSEIQAF